MLFLLSVDITLYLSHHIKVIRCQLFLIVLIENIILTALCFLQNISAVAV